MRVWTYKGKPLLKIPRNAFGFVYQVTTPEGQKYIGKKQFYSNRSKRIKGRTNRKHFQKESDWQTYCTSCEELRDRIKKSPKGFQFEILRICKTKGELSFGEVELQIKRNVLSAKRSDGTRKYINGNIMNRWFAERKKR